MCTFKPHVTHAHAAGRGAPRPLGHDQPRDTGLAGLGRGRALGRGRVGVAAHLVSVSRVSVQIHTTPPQNARQCTRPRSREMKGKHFSCAIGIAMTSIQTATTSCTGYCNTEDTETAHGPSGAILGPRTAHRQVNAAAVAAVGYGRGTCSLVASCPIRDLGQTNQPPACRWRRQHACSADAPCANSRTLSQPWSSKLSIRPRIAASWRGTF